MLGWALIINNLGRRRYPTFWWHPDSKFVASAAPQAEKIKEERDLERIEEGVSTEQTRSTELPEQELFQRLENEEGN
jgi:hypothetical protein